MSRSGNLGAILEAAAGIGGDEKYQAVIQDARDTLQKKGTMSARKTAQTLKTIYQTGNQMVQDVAENELTNLTREEISAKAEAEGIQITEEDIARAAAGAVAFMEDGKINDTLREISARIPMVLDVIQDLSRNGTQSGTELKKRIGEKTEKVISLFENIGASANKWMSDARKVAETKAAEATRKASEKMASAEQIEAVDAQQSGTATGAEAGTENGTEGNTGSRNARNTVIWEAENAETGETSTQGGELIRKEGNEYIVRDGDGNEQRVSASDAKAADTVTAAAMGFIESSVMDDATATDILQAAQSEKIDEKNIQALLQGARQMKIMGTLDRLTGGKMLQEGLKNLQFDPEVAQELYRKGAEETRQAEEVRRTGAENSGTILHPGEGKVTYREGVNLDEVSESIREQAEAVEAIAKKVGFNVIFENDSQNTNKYGEYDRGTDSVIINLNGLNKDGVQHHLMVTASHELTHLLEKNSPKAYDQLRQFIFQEMQQNKADIVARVMQKQDAYNSAISDMNMNQAEGQQQAQISINDAIAEIIADASDQVLGNESLIQKMAEQQPSLYQKVKNFVQDFVNKIRNAARGMRGSGSIDSMYIQNAEELAKKWGIALEEVQGKTKENNGDLASDAQNKFSFRDESGREIEIGNGDFENNIAQLANETPTYTILASDYQRFMSGNVVEEGNKYFAEIGGIAHNDTLGDVVLAKSGIRHIAGLKNNGNTNGITVTKAKTIPAIKYVIENGKIVDIDNNHNGKGVDTATLAAKVKMPDGDYVVGVVVAQDNGGTRGQKNRYRFHTAVAIKTTAPTAVSASLISGEHTAEVGGDHSVAKILYRIANYNIQSGQNSGNANSNNGENTSKTENIKAKTSFSLAEPIEQNKDGLVAVHNLTEENLRDTLKEGAFTAPSIAVVKAKSGHSKFGPISVIFNPEAIDPQRSRRNRIFGADAWTPTRNNAKIETSINEREMTKAMRGLNNLVEGLDNKLKTEIGNFFSEYGYNGQTDRMPGEWAEGAYHKTGMLAAYLRDNGEEVELKKTQERANKALPERKEKYDAFFNLLYNKGLFEEFWNDIEVNKAASKDLIERYADTLAEAVPETAEKLKAFRERPSLLKATPLLSWFSETRDYMKDGIATREAIDWNGTRNAMQEKITKDEFEKWFTGKIESVFGEKGIRNNADPFTAMGNRKSFKQLHMPVTAENIVKAMYTTAERKGEGAGPTGNGVIAAASKEYANLNEVRADRERLQQIEQGSYDKLTAEINDQLYNIAKPLAEEYGAGIDDYEEMIVDAAREYAKKPARKTIADYIQKEYDIQLSNEQLNEIQAMLENAREIPTGYFEAKPERVVRFDEINKVIIPEGSGLETELEAAGIQYETYDGTEEDRLEKLNNDSTRLFSIAEGTPDANDWIMGLDPKDFTGDALSIFNSAGIRGMVRNYQKLYTEIQETNRKIADLREAAKNARGDEQRKARINLETERNKLDRLQGRMNEITDKKEFGMLMQRAQATVDTFLRGKTQAEVEKNVAQMKKEAEKMRKTAAEAGEALETLAARENAAIAHSILNAEELTKAAAEIREYNNNHGNAQMIEDGIGEVAVKMLAGDGEGAFAEANRLADSLFEANWHSIRFGVFNGQRFQASDITGEIREDMVGQIIEKAAALMTTADTGENAGNQIKSLVKYVNSVTRNTAQAARGMARMEELAKGLQERGDALAKATDSMRGDLSRAIQYFNMANSRNRAEASAAQIEEITRTLESKAAQRVLEEQNKWAARMENDRNLRRLTEENRATRKKINTAYSRVAKLILAESDNRNVPEEMKGVAKAAVRMILDNEANGGKKITQLDWQTLQRNRSMLQAMDNRDGTDLGLDGIMDSIYGAELEGAEIENGQGLRDAIQEALNDIRTGLDYYNSGNRGRTAVNLEGDKAALEKIQQGMSAIYSMVSKAGQVFINGKNISTANAAYEVDSEARKGENYREFVGGLGKAIGGARNAIVLNNMTPEYFFKNLKNNGMSRIFDEFKRAEDQYGRIMLQAKNQIEEIAEKYKYKEWDTKTKHGITLESGEKVNLTLEQMMSLYATWKRETLSPGKAVCP